MLVVKVSSRSALAGAFPHGQVLVRPILASAWQGELTFKMQPVLCKSADFRALRCVDILRGAAGAAIVR